MPPYLVARILDTFLQLINISRRTSALFSLFAAKAETNYYFSFSAGQAYL